MNFVQSICKLVYIGIMTWYPITWHFSLWVQFLSHILSASLVGNMKWNMPIQQKGMVLYFLCISLLADNIPLHLGKRQVNTNTLFIHYKPKSLSCFRLAFILFVICMSISGVRSGACLATQKLTGGIQ